MDGNKIGVTSCKTAAQFHYRYSHDYTTTKCYNCGNHFYIRKYPRQKNLWLPVIALVVTATIIIGLVSMFKGSNGGRRGRA